VKIYRTSVLGAPWLLLAITVMPAIGQESALSASTHLGSHNTGNHARKSLDVKFRGGLISIRSQNATLGEVLSAISVKTGAEIDLPPALAGEHITAQLGPASTKEVLEQLLSSSRFDYVLLGSEQTGKVTHIVLREPETISSSADVERNEISNSEPANSEGASVDASLQKAPADANETQPQIKKQAKESSDSKSKSPVR
jgi:hypothetical protein